MIGLTGCYKTEPIHSVRNMHLLIFNVSHMVATQLVP